VAVEGLNELAARKSAKIYGDIFHLIIVGAKKRFDGEDTSRK